jgi:hypothetical protein
MWVEGVCVCVCVRVCVRVCVCVCALCALCAVTHCCSWLTVSLIVCALWCAYTPVICWVKQDGSAGGSVYCRWHWQHACVCIEWSDTSSRGMSACPVSSKLALPWQQVCASVHSVRSLLTDDAVPTQTLWLRLGCQWDSIT